MGTAPARWRHGRLLLCRPGDTLRVCGPPKKQIEVRSFLAPPQKAALGLASRPHSLLVPREKRGRKGENAVTEEIKTRQTARASRDVVNSGQQAGTGGASVRRTERSVSFREGCVSSFGRPDFGFTLTPGCGARKFFQYAIGGRFRIC